MSEKVKINFNGKEVSATPIDVTQADEHWNSYILDDTAKLRMKLITQKILRVDNEFDREGNPVYLIQSTNVTTVDVPDHLKKTKNN